jgi:hypothetical protein
VDGIASSCMMMIHYARAWLPACCPINDLLPGSYAPLALPGSFYLIQSGLIRHKSGTISILLVNGMRNTPGLS